MTCPKCQNAMSTPIRGRRTGLWLSSCVECGFSTRAQGESTPAPVQPNHGEMFRQQAPEELRVVFGTFTKFNREQTASAARKAILTRRELEKANRQDGRLKAAGSDL